MESVEKAYWNHEVSTQLGIGESTLRKWCIELEKNGYYFVKGQNNSRAFTDHDVLALTYFKNLTRDKNLSFKDASKAVVEKFSRRVENEGTTPILNEKSRSLVAIEDIGTTVSKLLEKTQKQEEVNKELLDHIKNQEQFNRALVERLEQQDKYIKESLEKRDKLLLESLNESLEARKEQAVAREKKKFGNKIKNLFKKK